MSFLAVSFEVEDPGPVAAFWAGMLDRDVVMEEGGALVSGDDTQVGLRFVAADVATDNRPNRIHLHLTSADLDDQHRSVTKAMQRGGRLIREYPEEGHVVMADPARNEFCVIEPGADFLWGTGYLGEVLRRPTRVGPFLAGRPRLAARVGSGSPDRDPIAGRRHEDLLGRPPRAARLRKQEAVVRSRRHGSGGGDPAAHRAGS